LSDRPEGKRKWPGKGNKREGTKLADLLQKSTRLGEPKEKTSREEEERRKKKTGAKKSHWGDAV